MDSSSAKRVCLGKCLHEVTRGVGASWSRYRLIGATRDGLAAAKEGVGQSPERYKLVEPGTIFYNPMRILLGSIAYLDEGGEPGITSPDYVVFRARPELVHPLWFYYWLRSDDGATFIRALARGAVRERMLFRRLATAEISVPSIGAQDLFARTIRLVERARAAAEAQDRLLWEESGHTPSRYHPEWWGGDIPWISLTDIRGLDGRNAYETREYTNDAGIANSAARVLPEGTVVLSRTASVGFVTVMGRPMATSQDFVNWVCGPELDPWFLAYLLIASRRYVRSLASGAVHSTVYVPTVAAFRVCVPALDEQQQISAHLKTQLAVVERLTSAIRGQREVIAALPGVLLRQAFAESGVRPPCPQGRRWVADGS